MNPDFTTISGPIHTKTSFNPQINTQTIQTAPTHGYGCTMAKKIFPIIRSHVLGPIKRPLMTSFDSHIRKTLKNGNKTQVGRNPTSRSLKKLPKSGTHTNPSPRRAFLLLVPKPADGRISRYSREKCSLSLKALKNGNSLHPKMNLTFLLGPLKEMKNYLLFRVLVT